MSTPALHWPNLAEPYASALREAVELIFQRTQPLGIVACGSVVQGTPSPSSDLDIYVVHAAGWRQRIQRRLGTVAVEIFINPPSSIRGYFEGEGRAGRPVTAHMLDTGFVVLDRDPVVRILLAEARQILAEPPKYSPEDVQFARYMAADAHENAQDMRYADPVTGLFLMGDAIQRMVAYRFLAANLYLPRPKDRLGKLAELDALAAELVEGFFRSENIEERFNIAARLAEYSIETPGFFEWESERQDVK